MKKLIFHKILIRPLKSEKGFTLIELLVVILILGILASVALVNMIEQVAKAREVEGKNNLAVLSRAQQAYHFENQEFSNSISDLLSNAVFESKYFSFPNPTIANASIVKHQAISTNPNIDQVRNYAIGVYFNAGIYDVTICESTSINATVNAPNTITDSCTNGGNKIR